MAERRITLFVWRVLRLPPQLWYALGSYNARARLRNPSWGVGRWLACWTIAPMRIKMWVACP
jgi:hypothetical protein